MTHKLWINIIFSKKDRIFKIFPATASTAGVSSARCKEWIQIGFWTKTAWKSEIMRSDPKCQSKLRKLAPLGGSGR